MRLADRMDKPNVEMSILGYEFPDRVPSDGRFDFDANWLIVSASFETEELSWSFRSACLMTTEALALGEWLLKVANDEVDPSDDDYFGRGWPTGAYLFVEPHLGVRFAASDGQARTLVWRFRHESAPPQSSEEVRHAWGPATWCRSPWTQRTYARRLGIGRAT